MAQMKPGKRRNAFADEIWQFYLSLSNDYYIDEGIYEIADIMEGSGEEYCILDRGVKYDLKDFGMIYKHADVDYAITFQNAFQKWFLENNYTVIAVWVKNEEVDDTCQMIRDLGLKPDTTY